MGSKDYEFLVNNNGNMAALVMEAYTQYTPFIMKKACLCERCSGGRILREDYSAGVFEKLYHYMGYIKLEKITNPDSFSFFIFVKRAAFRVYKNERKAIDKESCIINDDLHINSFEAVESEVQHAFEVEKFYSDLSPRQREIIEDRKNNIHEKVTRQRMGISHGTYSFAIRSAKKVFAQYI